MHLIIVYVKYLQSVFEWQKERTKPKQQRKKKNIKLMDLWTMAQNSIIYILCVIHNQSESQSTNTIVMGW